jgi:F-type H+-transporting ATPase subunit b
MIYFFSATDLITPNLGYSFWTLLAFVIFWLIMGKFAFRPIVASIEARNKKIEDELKAAQNARAEFESLKSERENMEREAREERTRLLLDAKAEVENFKAAELKKSKEEAEKLIEKAKLEIESQKNAAIQEVKNQVGALSVQIAEKLVQDKLETSDNQTALINKLIAQA